MVDLAAAVGAALTIGISGLATAMAEQSIGTAAIGAFTEKEELFGKGLIMTVLPETIVILGFVIAILMLMG